MPPAWMWPLDDELSDWFERVEEERKEKYGMGRDRDDDSTPMMQNELAKGRR